MAYGTMGNGRTVSTVNGTATRTVNGVEPTFSKTKEVKYGATSDKIFSISEAISASESTENIPDKIVVENVGPVPMFVMASYEDYTADSTAAGDREFLHILFPPGDKYEAPVRAVITSGSMSSAIIDGTAVTNEAPNSNMYTDSTANVDDGSGLDIIGSASETKLFLEPYTSAANCTANLFRLNDIIRVNDEVMRVVNIGDKSDLANNYLTVERGLYGSTAASDHADTAAVRFAFFNKLYDYDKYSVCQTDAYGRFEASNLMGKGRTATGNCGITPGSLNIKFYEPGFQKIGLSGVSSTTNSGLAVSTTYKFNITVDGGSTFADLSITTDSSNVNFGGVNGVIDKIQGALDTQYYTSGNLFEKKVTVSIEDGDIVFTSGQHVSGSAILLADPSSGTTPWGVGRYVSAANMTKSVPAKLPDDSIYDPVKYSASPTPNTFCYDDGRGNIRGMGCSGEISYETSAISLRGAPANAEFVFSCIENTAFSGMLNTGETGRANCLDSLFASTPSQKFNGHVRITAV